MVWVCGIACILEVQSFCLTRRPQLSTGHPARSTTWLAFDAYMAAAGLVILIGYAIALPPMAAWVVLWYPALGISVWATVHHVKHQVPPQQPAPGLPPIPEGGAGVAAQLGAGVPIKQPPGLDSQKQAEAAAVVEMHQQPSSPIAAHHAEAQPQPPLPHQQPSHVRLANASGASDPPPADAAPAACCSRSGAAFRQCMRIGQVLGWSSIFWLSLLAFFLALQASWLASDAQRFGAPGAFVTVRAAEAASKPKPGELSQAPKDCECACG